MNMYVCVNWISNFLSLQIISLYHYTSRCQIPDYIWLWALVCQDFIHTLVAVTKWQKSKISPSFSWRYNQTKVKPANKPKYTYSYTQNNQQSLMPNMRLYLNVNDISRLRLIFSFQENIIITQHRYRSRPTSWVERLRKYMPLVYKYHKVRMSVVCPNQHKAFSCRLRYVQPRGTLNNHTLIAGLLSELIIKHISTACLIECLSTCGTLSVMHGFDSVAWIFGW